ncbi:MAG: hypothetical protein IKH51_05220 [Clostridia bacterium]|nr:hypothetical protein [Clostridia bacterium]
MYSTDNPWIKEREATLCTWKFDYDRGYVSNTSVSLINDFMSLSDRQLSDYAKMIKECGFTGIQVMDICSAWRYGGGYENVHDKFKTLSEAAHAAGLNFTVWCWAAEFSGHGWSEPDAVYQNADPSKPAYLDSRVHALFEKYYDIYADLAPFSDRVIAHFFDPGNLTDMPSIIYFVKLLTSKFRQKNPDIKIAVDTWGCPEGYPQALVDAGMDGVMLMELPFLPIWRQPGKRADFRQGVKKLGCELGSWGWYDSDMEIDQIPLMTVNNRVLKDVFAQTRAQADHVMTPCYWSETDSYHILNFFSLYAAGHLLTDPEGDPDKLLYDSACKITGQNKKDAERLTTVLELIRDARSGDSWETYWWTEPGYVLKHGDAENILDRSDNAIASLKELINEPEPKGGIPFPITRRQLYKLILPHLYQIKQYAQLRCGLEEVKRLCESGAPKEELQAKIDRLPCEIPEYNCVTGLWGQSEARCACELTGQFCRENGLQAPQRPGNVRFAFKRRLIDRLTVEQRGKTERVWVQAAFYEGGMPDIGFIRSLLDELAADQVLEKDGDKYTLTDWQNYGFDFSM